MLNHSLTRVSLLLLLFYVLISHVWTTLIWHGYMFPLRNQQLHDYVDESLIKCNWLNPLAGDSPIHSILDFGAGQGDSSVIFGSLVHPDHPYVAVDVYTSQRWIAPPHVQRIIISPNQTTLPFDDITFDLVVITTVLHHIPRQQHALILTELTRIAKRIIIIEDLISDGTPYYNQWVYFFDSLCNMDFLQQPPHSNRDDMGWKSLFQQISYTPKDKSGIRHLSLIHQSYMLLGTDNSSYSSANELFNMRIQTWSPITKSRIVNAIYVLQVEEK